METFLLTERRYLAKALSFILRTEFHEQANIPANIYQTPN